MSTPIVEEKTPSDEEPASKKLRLEDELFSNVENEVEDPCDDSLQQLQDDACTQNESNEASTQLTGSPDVVNKAPRGKHKYAVLLSYCGKGYFGMQRNPGVRTIEEDLIQAVYKAGAISEDMRDNLGKMFFQRCARTDKGVSAVRQLVSLKMTSHIHMYEVNANKDKINEHLPAQIRVIAVIRVTKKFNSKDYCVARSYEYLLPTFALSPTFEQTRRDFRITTSPYLIIEFCCLIIKNCIFKCIEVYDILEGEQIERVDQLLLKFVGTHNFHNFTSGKSPNEASAKRYIKEFCSGKKFEAEGMEFIVLQVKGQSFMLHQIRKMIGLIIAIMRNIASEDTLVNSFENDKADIPMAPGLGLMLENVFFDGYNKRYGDDGTHSPLNWDQFYDEIEAFKNEHIYSYITRTENVNGTVMQWLGSIPRHSFDKTPAVNLTVKEAKKEVEEQKTTELTNTTTEANHTV